MNKLTECCRTSTTERNELNVSKPVLHYFDIFGRASPARMAFTVAKESFEDRRIQLSDWPQHKNTFLTGQVPALQIGDETYYESIPISYYAARNTTLIPSNSLERLQIDSVVNFVSNAWKLNSKIYHTKPEDKERVTAELIQKDIPHALDIATRLVTEIYAHDASPWINGKGMTIADIWMYCWIHALQFNMFNVVVPNIAKRWPKLWANYTAVKEDPKLKEYLIKEC